MKRKHLFFQGMAVLILMILSSCSQPTTDRIIDKKFIDPIKEARKDYILHMEINRIPGSSVAVSYKGKTIWSEGLGLASTNLEVPAGRATKYRAGKVSQIITALAYQILAEEGKISPDSTVRHYLPDFPQKKWGIKLSQLADHSSGIRPPTLKEEKWSGIRNSIERGLELFENDTLIFEPGTYQLLSMYNYNLLGAIIEKEEGKKFREVISEVVTDSLGMTNTVPDNPFITIKGKADFFDLNYMAQIINALSADFTFKMPSMGYLSTADDLVKLGNAFLYSGYIPDSVKTRFFKPTVFPEGSSNWANGWIVMKSGTGQTIYGARGEVTGSGVALLVYPNQELVVAIMTNLSDDSVETPAFKVANAFIKSIEN